MRFLTWAAISLAIVPWVFFLASDANAQNPISIKAGFEETKNDNVVTVSISFKIDDGWHAYASVEDGNPAQVMTCKLELPEGVSPASRWTRPEFEESESGAEVYVGEGKFTRKILISPKAIGQKIGVKCAYQVCDEEACMAPTEFKTELVLERKASEDVQDEQTTEEHPFQNKHFSTPERLMADDMVLNQDVGQLYVSPGLSDIDGDGTKELLVGAVDGKIRVYKNLSQDKKGEPVWSDYDYLTGQDGEAVEGHNW